MKKIIPFTKEIEFKSMISKITSISLEHTLRVSDESSISGDFIISGTYKMTQASQIDEEFSYKIPIDISIDDRYDTANIYIDIDDFTYEIIDEEKLKLNISLSIDNLEEKKLRNVEIKEDSIFNDFEEFIENDDVENNDSENNSNEDSFNDEETDLFLDLSSSKKLEIPNDDKKENKKENINSLFGFNNDNETFSTYSIYIVKEQDTIEDIINKYNVTREDLEEYNVLSEIKVGTKVIIPYVKNE